MKSLVASEWYEAKELAAMLGISVRSLKRSGIPCSPLTRIKTLYLGADVLAWLAARKQQGRLRQVGGNGPMTTEGAA